VNNKNADRTAEAVKDLEEARNTRARKLQKARAIFKDAEECSELLFKEAGLPTSTDIDCISQFSFDIIAKPSASYLEAFVRIRLQKNVLESWKAPSKGSKKKVEDGMNCKQTKGKFLIQLVQDLASTKPVAQEPDLVAAIFEITGVGCSSYLIVRLRCSLCC